MTSLSSSQKRVRTDTTEQSEINPLLDRSKWKRIGEFGVDSGAYLVVNPKALDMQHSYQQWDERQAKNHDKMDGNGYEMVFDTDEKTLLGYQQQNTGGDGSGNVLFNEEKQRALITWQRNPLKKKKEKDGEGERKRQAKRRFFGPISFNVQTNCILIGDHCYFWWDEPRQGKQRPYTVAEAFPDLKLPADMTWADFAASPHMETKSCRFDKGHEGKGVLIKFSGESNLTIDCYYEHQYGLCDFMEIRPSDQPSLFPFEPRLETYVKKEEVLYERLRAEAAGKQIVSVKSIGSGNQVAKNVL